MLYSKTDTESIQTIINILVYFSRISRQKINGNKFKLYFSPSAGYHTRQRISSLLGIPLSNSLGKYLGFPLSNKLTYDSSFNFLTKKLHKRLNYWENKFLTNVGKATLIKTTLSCIPIHTMQFIKLPKKPFLELIEYPKIPLGFYNKQTKTPCCKLEASLQNIT